MKTVLIIYQSGAEDIYVEARKQAEKKEEKYFDFFFMNEFPNDLFNKSFDIAAKRKEKVFIMCEDSIQINKKWIDKFVKSGEYKKYSFICNSEDMNVVVFNVDFIRKFGKFKYRTGTLQSLYSWLKNKSVSEGYRFRFMNQSEMNTLDFIELENIAGVEQNLSISIDESTEVEPEINNGVKDDIDKGSEQEFSEK